MKNVKRFIGLIAVIGVIGVAGAAYAADIKTPADIAAALTGKSVTVVNEQRAEGKTYGTIAKEAGKLEEFKVQMLEQKKMILDQRVKTGTLTQQQADKSYNRIKSNQAVCDGTGNAGIGKNNGAGFGQRKGMGRGMGCGAEMGNGNCNGMGCRMGI